MITKKGTVIKQTGEKTIKVEVVEHRTHSKYKKLYRVSKKFLVHDESGKVKIGDTVVIVPCKKLSTSKSWTLQTSNHNTKETK